LFVGRKPVGVIEAKCEDITVGSLIFAMV